MSDLDPRMARLAAAFGIATQFWDWKGQYREASPATVLACLAALGVETDQEGWLDKAFIEADERPWRQPLPACIVAEQHQERYVDVHVPAGRPAHTWVRLEDGSTFILDQVDNFDADRLIDDHWVGRATFRLPTMVVPGYHTLFLESDDQSWETDFIVTPGWVGTSKLGLGSVWGFMAQLYSVCGESSWGVGDFADLTDLAVWAKTGHGADYVLINPTHAAQIVPPMEPSPYLPSTRRYTNPLYIRPEAIEEYSTASDDLRAQVQFYRREALGAAQASERIERDAVWQAKKAALRLIFRLGLRPSRQMEFEAYAAAQGPSLRSFAVWCALTEAYGQVWTAWPDPYQHPESAEVAQFERAHGSDVRFHLWLQWIADSQARDAQATAVTVGMRIGVMSDLAVGVNQVGEETWSTREVFAHGVSVGAPPDAYNQSGQNWQQPPWRPDKLESASYGPWRALVSSILARAGAVRVDHIIGLFRLWWIPEGTDPADGVYIQYNHEAMVGILALEALRAGAMVIGEDLGTVEPSAREYLAKHGILGTSVLWFENDAVTGAPLDPAQWRTLCLGSVTTHDLPPTLGYLAHDHIALRYRLGLLTESLEDEIERDATEQRTVLKGLAGRELIAQGESDPRQVMLGLHRFLFQTPAKLKCVALTDAVGERRTQNQPGTINEYPNWRVPLAGESGQRLSLEQVYALDCVTQLTDIMNGKA